MTVQGVTLEKAGEWGLNRWPHRPAKRDAQSCGGGTVEVRGGLLTPLHAPCEERSHPPGGSTLAAGPPAGAKLCHPSPPPLLPSPELREAGGDQAGRGGDRPNCHEPEAQARGGPGGRQPQPAGGGAARQVERGRCVGLSGAGVRGRARSLGPFAWGQFSYPPGAAPLPRAPPAGLEGGRSLRQVQSGYRVTLRTEEQTALGTPVPEGVTAAEPSRRATRDKRSLVHKAPLFTECRHRDAPIYPPEASGPFMNVFRVYLQRLLVRNEGAQRSQIPLLVTVRCGFPADPVSAFSPFPR